MCSLKECLIVVGILLGYLVSYLFIDTTGGWRYMFGLAAIPTLALGLGMVRPCALQLPCTAVAPGAGTTCPSCCPALRPSGAKDCCCSCNRMQDARRTCVAALLKFLTPAARDPWGPVSQPGLPKA